MWDEARDHALGEAWRSLSRRRGAEALDGRYALVTALEVVNMSPIRPTFVGAAAAAVAGGGLRSFDAQRTKLVRLIMIGSGRAPADPKGTTIRPSSQPRTSCRR